MQVDVIDVFDFDGTIIKANSFREITKKTLLLLLKKFRFNPLCVLAGVLILRKTVGILVIKGFIHTNIHIKFSSNTPQ